MKYLVFFAVLLGSVWGLYAGSLVPRQLTSLWEESEATAKAWPSQLRVEEDLSSSVSIPEIYISNRDVQPDGFADVGQSGFLELREIGGVTTVSIGEQMNPGDPHSWSSGSSHEDVLIGEPKDPYDQSQWPDTEGLEPVNIGNLMLPGDPYGWNQGEGSADIEIGEPLEAPN